MSSTSDDGTPDQGSGDATGTPGSDDSMSSTSDDGTPDQGSGDAPGTPGSNETSTESSNSSTSSSDNSSNTADNGLMKTWIEGTSGNDDIVGTSGDDEIHAPLGFNKIDGGAGEDTLVIYEGNRSDFTVTRSADGSVIVEGPGLNCSLVRQEMQSIERIQFNDMVLYTDTLPLSDQSSGDQSTGGQPGDDLPSNITPPAIMGTDESEWIAGRERDNSIFAGGGDDEIHAPLGNNIIDGGDGEDTLIIYEGNLAEFTLSRTSNGSIIVEGPGLNGKTVRSILSNVERILFNDQVVMTSEIGSSSSNSTSSDS